MRLRIRSCILFLFFLMVFFTAGAQQVNVRVRIINSKNEAVSFATVQLISVNDTNQVEQKLSDSTGILQFNAAEGAQYTLRFSAVNYLPAQKGIVVKGTSPLFTMVVEPSNKNLKTVVVTASRPLMRQEDDKTIIDPENLVASSTTAYEVIEKTPGLFVDPDGNIYLSSTRPATIYINGREQRMSAADIATMFKNLPPNSIASIEVLRTPSARYDASGSGGIVNVVLKKGVRIGFTGSITGGLNKGRYGNGFAGFNLNNNNGSVTSYINLQYGRRNNYDKLQTNRSYSIDSILAQEAFTRYKADSWYLGFGLNKEISKKWEVGFDGRVSYGSQDNNSSNLSQTYKAGSSQSSFSNLTEVNNKITTYNINGAANLKYKFDSVGSEWATDFSYTYAPNHTEQLFTHGDGDIQNKLHFISAQTNVVKKFRQQITVETGVKTTDVWFTNSTGYFRLSNGGRLKDGSRTGSYKYREGIHAAYLQASKNISGVILKIGTRLENTNMKGLQLSPKDTSFTLHRTDLFPYIYLSRNLMKIAGYDLKAYLVYRRTINRPAYEQLNPSIRFIDPFLFETGNPSLRPQFTRNYEANISVNERPIFAVGINDTKDIFTQVVYAADTSEKLSLRTYDNLGKNRESYFRILGALPPGKRYFFVMGAQYNHNFYQGVYEKNDPLSFKKGSWSLFTYHMLRVSPTTQFSFHGFVRINGQQQFYELSNFGQLNVNLTQQLLSKKLTLTLNVNDVFFTNNNEFKIDQGSIRATGYRESDTRRVGVNIRYNFGFRKKEENNLFNIDSPERGQ